MKINLKKFSVATMSLTYLLLSPLSYAVETSNYDGTVTINGEVVSQTCKVETGKESITVDLAKVGTSSLSSLGKVAANKTFAITLQNCTTPSNGAPKTVGIYFGGFSAYVDYVNSGTLKNTHDSNPAKNVNVQLLNDDGTAIKLGSNINNGVASSLKYVSIDDNVSDNKIELQYQAQYYATGQATVGKVQAIVPFSIVYQ